MIEDPAAAFRLLGLGASADAEAVRAAFRKMVSATHPDVVGDTGSEPTLALLAAYRTAIGFAESIVTQPAASSATKPSGPVWMVDADTIALRCSHEEAFVRMLEVGYALGSITYLDREGELIEVLLRTKLGDTLSLVISFQGRNDWVEAFLTTEVLDTAKHELPTTAQIAELYAHQLVTRWS